MHGMVLQALALVFDGDVLFVRIVLVRIDVWAGRREGRAESLIMSQGVRVSPFFDGISRRNWY